MAYKITDACVKCGACADNCPVEAISEGDEKYVIDADVCVSCGARRGHRGRVIPYQFSACAVGLPNSAGRFLFFPRANTFSRGEGGTAQP